MEIDSIEKKLKKYNNLFREYNGIYTQAIKNFKLPECAFWILYALNYDEYEKTQTNIYKELFFPKQTVNSSLKKLKDENIIEFKNELDKRTKEIVLTSKGKELSKQTVQKVYVKELAAVSKLNQSEQDNLISLFEKITNSLKENLKDIKGESNDNNN